MSRNPTDKPAITSIAPWFGGKRTLAPTIVTELGDHRAYWEPCCGSMAVLLAKPPSSHETVNDLHGDLINLARVVADDDLAPKLYNRLQRTLMAEPLVSEATAAVAEPFTGGDTDLDRAYAYFVMSWGCRNGVSGTKRQNFQMAVRWTPGGGAGGTRFHSAVASLPWWHRRISRATILRRDMFALLASIDDVHGVAIYLDPPYLRTGARTGCATYLHEFDSDHHRQLAEAASRFRHARVVISYYDDPALKELYPPDQWTKREVHTNKNLHVQNRRGSKKTLAPEVLLLNGPSYAKADEQTLWAATP